MRAFEIQGVGIERLVAVDRPEPRPAAGEVLLRMRAAALNARDLQIPAGHYPAARGFPLVPLSDGVGEVVAVGLGVTRVARGDRVAGIFAERWLHGERMPATWASTLGGDRDGVLQELVVLHEDGVVHVPPHLSDEEAATLPIAGVTAWQALMVRGSLRPGDDVLVQGTGGVALFALQFARLAGARVIAVSRSPAKHDRLRSAGAAEVVDGTAADWVAQVVKLTGGRGVDHVVDVIGDLSASLGCLRTGGVVSLVGYLGGMRVESDLIPILLGNARLNGISVGPRSTFEAMNRAVALHRLRPIVDAVFPFARAPEAFTHFLRGPRFGKVVVRFRD